MVHEGRRRVNRWFTRAVEGRAMDTDTLFGILMAGISLLIITKAGIDWLFLRRYRGF